MNRRMRRPRRGVNQPVGAGGPKINLRKRLAAFMFKCLRSGPTSTALFLPPICPDCAPSSLLPPPGSSSTRTSAPKSSSNILKPAGTRCISACRRSRKSATNPSGRRPRASPPSAAHTPSPTGATWATTPSTVSTSVTCRSAAIGKPVTGRGPRCATSWTAHTRATSRSTPTSSSTTRATGRISAPTRGCIRRTSTSRSTAASPAVTAVRPACSSGMPTTEREGRFIRSW